MRVRSPAMPFVFLLATAATAQEWLTWQRWPSQGGRMVFDERDARMLVFDQLGVPLAYTIGRQQLLQWNGSAFWPRRPAPPAGFGIHAAAFEPISRRVFVVSLFGPGLAYDGTTWSSVPMPPVAGGFGSVTLVRDPVRGQLALLGYPPTSTASPLQTWHFDGVAWTQAATSGAPLVFGQIGAAADTARGRIVLLNGNNHFEWDGVQWQRVGQALGAAVAYDSGRQRVVLHLGTGNIAEYDGSSWVQSAATGPNGFTSPGSFVFDPTDGETLALVPPLSGGTPLLWSWNGQRWLQRGSASATTTAGGALHDPTRGRLISLGGNPASYDLLAWEGHRWQVAGSGLPGVTMTFDSFRQRVVGTDDFRLFALTGAAMTPIAQYPNWLFSVRDVFACDAAGTLLNAGASRSGSAFWTSTWDGVTFSHLSPSLSSEPGPRVGTCGGWHAASAGVILFGGIGGVPLNDTWWFRNGAWTRLFPANSPPPRGYAWMAVDPQSGELLLGGGRVPASAIERFDVWAWNGSNWRQLPWPSGSAAFDPVRSVMTVVNGFSLAFHSSQAPSVTAFGSGCGGRSLGPPTLHAIGDPALGNDTFAVRVGNVAPPTMAFLMMDLATAPWVIGACTVYLPTPMTHSVLAADAWGGRTFAMSVPFVPALRGLPVYVQGGAIDFAPGALFGQYSLTPALALRLGD